MNKRKYNVEILFCFILLFLICILNLSKSLTYSILSIFALLFIIICFIGIYVKKVDIPIKHIRNILFGILCFSLIINIPIYTNVWKNTKLDFVQYNNIRTIFVPVPYTIIDGYTFNFYKDNTVTITHGSRVSSSGQIDIVEGEFFKEDGKLIIISTNGSKYVFSVYPTHLKINVEESCAFFPDFGISSSPFFCENIISKLKHKIYGVEILN